MNSIQVLWDEISSEASNTKYFDQEIDGVDLFELNYYLAQAIENFLDNNGIVDATQTDVIRRCKDVLEGIEGKIDKESRVFFELLLSISKSILKEADNAS